MKRKRDKNKIGKYLLLIIGIIVILEITLFIISKSINIEKKNTENITNNSVIFNHFKNFKTSENGTIVRIKLPAVDSKGNGVSTILTVEAIPGSGRTLVDIESLLFWADTQQSIRMARLVADKYTNESIENYDLIYSIEANASIIGGPSAGAALTLATIFALNHQKPRDDVMITGTINHDGTIGPVSSIMEKAKASKEAGAKKFLVPLLQSRDVVYETKKHCQKFGFSEFCYEETIPKQIDVSKEAGIEVIEVSSIEEALKYFKD